MNESPAGPADAGSPPATDPVRDKAAAGRMALYMRKQRLNAAGGFLPACYVAWLVSPYVAWRDTLVWLALIIAVDLVSTLHSSRFLALQRAGANLDLTRWRRRQIALQSAAGVAWGSSALWLQAAPEAQFLVLLVLVAVTAIGAIAMLDYHAAVLAHSASIWALPFVVLAMSDQSDAFALTAGVLVMLVSVNFYALEATRQLRQGTLERFRGQMLNESLREAAATNLRLATYDELTGLFNRREGMQRLDEMLREPGRPGVLVADVDHFKRINDTHGHPAGDEVLRVVARRMQGALRPTDTLARLGGEEFLVVLAPGSAPDVPAERLRRAVADEPITLDDGTAMLAVSVSIGSAIALPAEAPADLLSRADRALYQAKADGRNRVVVATVDGAPTPAPDRLARLRAMLDSTDGNDPLVAAPGQLKCFRCGELLLEDLNATGGRGAFAHVMLHGTERVFAYGGSRHAAALWRTVVDVVRSHLPAQAYVGRVTTGIVIHAWGDDAARTMPDALWRFMAALSSLELPRADAAHPAFVPLTGEVGFLVYPDDCGRLDTFAEVTRRVAIASFGVARSLPATRITRHDESRLAPIDRLVMVDTGVDPAPAERRLEPMPVAATSATEAPLN